MGLYDRDYYRDPRGGLSLAFPTSVVGRVILATSLVWLANGLYGQGDALASLLALRAGDLLHPWMWWRFLSYGLAHDPGTVGHLFFNMLGLWFFGRDMEQLYGSREFFRLYLAFLAVGALPWAVLNVVQQSSGAIVFGASGAVVGMIVLFALHYPRRMVLLFFFLPVPAWVLGVLLVGSDLLSALQRAPGNQVAYGVHLAGAAMAYAYFRFHWNLGDLAGRLTGRLHRRPKLRVYTAEDRPPPVAEEDLSAQVDVILAKIHRQGESSLTRHERQILETASREYQRRRHSADEP